VEKKTSKVVVEREIFEMDGKQYYTYFVKGNVRGVDVRASVMPPDRGGYTVLDIVFGKEMKAELISTPFEIKDDATGKVVKGVSYSVRSFDENGEVYECAIKPYRSSDKSLLNMILR